jgi:hypothetical protein
MRLTLRTMLCYLDDVLEPADAVELGKKIEDSEYASQVVHRIRTSMRRLRLGAPKLTGEGVYDPNTVADYLDNTLPPEQVADFERVCLDPETEVQLAEVAACHQILTLVLGEPAEVPQTMRQRIYNLAHPDAASRSHLAHEPQQITNGALSEEAAARAVETPAAAASVAAPPVTEVNRPVAEGEATPRTDEAELTKRDRQKPEVPAYLKEGTKRGSWWPAALVLALAGVAVAGIIYSRMRNANPAPVVANTAPEANDKLFAEEQDEAEPSGSENASTEAAEAPEATSATDNAVATTNAAEDAEAAVAADSLPPASAAGDEPKATDLIVGPADGDRETDVDDGDVPPADSTDDLSVAKVEPGEGDAPPAGEGTVVLPLVDRVLGHYTSTGQLLVAYDAKLDSWNRLASRTGLKPGMHVRALPTYRPQILLENALQITLCGEGELIIGNPTEDGTPFLNIPYGRMMLATMSKAGNAAVLRAGEREALLTMVNADAEVALEVARFHSPGVDPTSELAHVQVTMSVTSGQVTWRGADGSEATLDAGHQLTLVDDQPPKIATEAPDPTWTKTSSISDIDRRASATLEPLLVMDGPIEVKLEELCEDPRVEVRSLAMRGLAALDRFERIFETLKDESLKSYWAQHIEQLQQAMAHSTPVAHEVRAAAVRASGADGEKLYRLLWGYSPEQLQKEGAKQLVEMLKHPSLEFRVVAINLLRNITGRTQGYHPHLPEARRRTADRQWDASLAAGEVVYAAPPAVLPPRKLAEMP